MSSKTTFEPQALRNFSDSLINVFEENPGRAVNSSPTNTDPDTLTLESFSQQAAHDNQPGRSLSEEDLMSKMTFDEYMLHVFGPSLNEEIKNLPFREKMKKILHSNYLHAAVIILVILDSICVIIELVIDLEDLKENDKFEVVEKLFKYLGLSILSLFVFEISLKLIFLFKDVIKSKLEILDAVVVLISFIVEIVFLKNKDPLVAIAQFFLIILSLASKASIYLKKFHLRNQLIHKIKKAKIKNLTRKTILFFLKASLILLFRVWRIIRIVNGIILAVKKPSEAKIEKLKTGLNALIKENDLLKIDLNKKITLLDDIKIAYDF